jgi:hypothetical protein
MARALTFASLSVLAAFLATPVWADPAATQPANSQVVAAAPAGASAPPSDASPAAAPAKVAQPWGDDDADDATGPDDKKIHGEMGVGVGTNGYREVYGAATVPLPDGGQASIAVDAGQIGPYHR